MAQTIQHRCYPAPSSGITAACAPRPWFALEKRWRAEKPAQPPTAASFQRLRLIPCLDLTLKSTVYATKRGAFCRTARKSLLGLPECHRKCCALEHRQILQNIATVFLSHLYQTEVNADQWLNINARRASPASGFMNERVLHGKAKLMQALPTDSERQFSQ